MKMKAIKRIIVCICAFLAIWITVCAIDFFRVKSFEKPVFILKTETSDDGGSGMYYGIGYSFDIAGKFMPNDEEQGIIHYKFYIMNLFITEGTNK